MDNNWAQDFIFYLLFNEVPEKIPDPNNPANIPRLKALRKAEEDKLKMFFAGPGAVLLKRWKSKIQSLILDMFRKAMVEQTDCNCKTCQSLREANIMIKLMMEAETIIESEEK